MNSKTIIIIAGIVVGVLIIGVAAFLFLSGDGDGKISDTERKNNIIKLINRYIEKEEYERALNKVEELLIENVDDDELLKLQDKILALKNEKKAKEDEEEREKDLEERQKLLDSMNTIIEKTDEKPIIIRETADSSQSTEKDQRKAKKINKFIEEGIDEYNNQNYPVAKNKFLNALKLDDTNAEANAYLGITLYEEDPQDDKNVEEAIKKIKKALKKNNNLEIAHFTLAKIYDDQGLKDLAIEEYKETLKLNPKRYEAFYSLGRIYYKDKHYEDAQSHFNNAVKIKPDYVNAYYYLGQTNRRLGDYNEAKDNYKKIINLDPSFYLAFYSLGEILRGQDGNYKEALKNYQVAAKLSNKYKYYQKIGECYRGLSNHEEAIKNYLTAISLNPKSSSGDIKQAVHVYEILAEIQKNTGNYKESLKYVTEGLKLDDQSSVLYYISAFSNSKLKNTDTAIEHYLKALNLNPKDIESYINLSKLYNEIDKHEDSIKIAQKGITYDTGNYKLYNNLGDSLQKLNNYEQAIVAYKKSVEINPASPTIYYNLGICYKELDEKDNSIKSFQQAIFSNNEYYDAYYELGAMLFTTKNYEEAKKILKILLDKKPDYPKREQIDKMLSFTAE